MATTVSAPVFVGRFVWLELATSDAEAAIAFYSKVVGWTATPMAGPIPYTVWNNTRGPVAGMMTITPEMKSRGVPPTGLGTSPVPTATPPSRKPPPSVGRCACRRLTSLMSDGSGCSLIRRDPYSPS